MTQTKQQKRKHLNGRRSEKKTGKRQRKKKTGEKRANQDAREEDRLDSEVSRFLAGER